MLLIETFKVSKVVIFEGICKKIYQKISNLKNSIDKLLIGRFNQNYKTNQCSFIYLKHMVWKWQY